MTMVAKKHFFLLVVGLLILVPRFVRADGAGGPDDEAEVMRRKMAALKREMDELNRRIEERNRKLEKMMEEWKKESMQLPAGSWRLRGVSENLQHAQGLQAYDMFLEERGVPKSDPRRKRNADDLAQYGRSARQEKLIVPLRESLPEKPEKPAQNEKPQPESTETPQDDMLFALPGDGPIIARELQKELDRLERELGQERAQRP